MSKGGDPRAQRSRQALEAALLARVEAEDLARISISDITKRAGVSRSTFYEHYADVHDLAASACTEIFDQLVSNLPLADPQLIHAQRPDANPVVPLFRHFAEHARLYRSLLGPDGSARVINHVLHRMRVRTGENLRMAAPADQPENAFDAEATLIAGALLGTVVDWLRNDGPGTPEQLAETVWPLLVGAATASGLDKLVS
jgi:AcrR family transcriptional regulator